MITFDRTAPATNEWRRGRVVDPNVSSQSVPDLSEVTGYTLEDVLYNQGGRQSPSQQSQGYKGIVGELFGIALCGALAVFGLVHGLVLIPSLMLLCVAYAAVRLIVDLKATSTGDVSCVEGDIWTQVVRDSEGEPDSHFVHVGGMRLWITAQAYNALRAGGPYRIYYVAGRGVGGQVLPGWRAAPPKPKKRGWWQTSIELGA